MATELQTRNELVEALLDRISQAVGDRAKVSTIFGEPVEREGITVIPVAKARFGFGGGAGSGTGQSGEEGSGGGGGGGAMVSPVGYIEVRAGSAEFKRIGSPVDLLILVAAASLGALALQRLLAG